MEKRSIGRREFLRLAVASAAAVGLSHFRILNYGGPKIALARTCETGDPGASDTCDATSTDWCIPVSMAGGDPDICNDQTWSGGDMCPDDSPSPQPGPDICSPDLAEPDACLPTAAEADICDTTMPGYDPDLCVPGDEDTCAAGAFPPNPDACNAVGPDACNPPADPDVCGPNDAPPDACDPPADPDVCEVPPDGPDSCQIASQTNPDICPDKQGGGDVCTIDEGDVCLGGASESDYCVYISLYCSDICPEPGGGSSQDICDPTYNPDVCSPSWDPDVCNGDTDSPNAVTLQSLKARPVSVALPVLGGAVAALGAAAAWLRHRHNGPADNAD